MINIKIMCIGKVKEKPMHQLINEYLKRISKYAKIEIIELEDEKLPSSTLSLNEINQIKTKESDKIIDKINKYKNPYIIALDLKGKALSSEQLSNKISEITVNGFSTICFVIGGTLGLSTEILNLCNYKICFSNLTFPHQLIRLFLCEQLFRVFKIQNNETYHH